MWFLFLVMFECIDEGVKGVTKGGCGFVLCTAHVKLPMSLIYSNRRCPSAEKLFL
jgi:hypothetical protein